jgi:diphthine-ammonia ligase
VHSWLQPPTTLSFFFLEANTDMTSSLNVIALISGGKDSLFSILHCQANGHTVVALANLHPPPSTNGDEDINSYMYQTVGHSVIPLYEQALGIPLYRQEITGSAVNARRDYEEQTGTEQDETEDLVPLLKKAMEAHPEANAVSTGAILSTYQRTRVESVAIRLGLTPLSYLWQYPLLPPYTQSSLLHDMAAVGQEAVIIKTASGGLDESFLGLDVANRRTIAKVSKAMARYGEAGDGAIVGEGGEFETLAVGGPRPLWKKRLVLHDALPEAIGGQAVLKIRKCSVEEMSESIVGGLKALRVPELFDDEFKRILEKPDEAGKQDGNPSSGLACGRSKDAFKSLPTNVCYDTSAVFTCSNLVNDTRAPSKTGPAWQLQGILLRLDHVLKQRKLHRSHITHCTLLLRDMKDFSLLNPVYAQYFNDINPPARVTIAVPILPAPLAVILHIILDKDSTTTNESTSNRQGLHVQGRSYWAPANIGPYSQSISARLPPSHPDTKPSEIVYVAGQIPLIPASMQMYTLHGFKGQALLSLQHLWRIGRTKAVTCWTAGVAFIPAGSDAEQRVRTAQETWRAIHTQAASTSSSSSSDDDDDEVDPWDRMNRHGTATFNDNTYRSPIPAVSSIAIPPCFVAQVCALPRGADIEWCATGLTSQAIQVDRQGKGSVTSLADSRARFYTLEIGHEDDVQTWRELGHAGWTTATVYAAPGFDEVSGHVGLDSMGVQWIPCLRVWGDGGREVRAVLVGRIDEEVG